MNDIAREPVLGGAPAPATPQPRRLRFTGSGSEYFRIWSVNLLLTIVTLGIYYPWAKVRRLQYFYRNTQLDRSSFNYHGSPIAILKGWAIMIVLGAALRVAGNVSHYLWLAMFVAFMLVFPWLLQRSLSFRMANSSYRGLRFAFTGTTAGAYQAFLLWPLAACVSAGFLAPLAHQRFKQYQHSNTRVGTAPFSFSATAGGFYAVYLKMVGLVMAAFLVAVGAGFAMMARIKAAIGTVGPDEQAILFVAAFFAIGVVVYAIVPFLGPYFMARTQNLVWNCTTLGAHRFRSEVSARKLFWIFISNVLLTLITLGLYRPFAQVRMARYKLESVTLLAVGSLDTFVAGETTKVGALGDQVVDWYDIDIAL
ncbi:YjgN family protein [Ralstonia solanacearum]|uniref:DUF898 domain-containing protein n=1 Tax=Ralstonia solanacearum TaxID=305 RepID=A0AAW5ZL81_RALSL|nr:YjgN family protein [Ralstonia solanacearum]AYB52361.2 DUF898 domain-containing protein [Ralstonia solanacearum]AYB56920.2 DUF898 domain-containing protein [Ralstonia solanacearum]MDB0570514.1 DUF898 domain-containing protein [Ralstonia solanacearum]OAI74619.1 membrane protein [Ralstonia solanacearum]RCW11109.1 hypothetical protein RSP816_10820 [Ralstonia solanacearum]